MDESLDSFVQRVQQEIDARTGHDFGEPFRKRWTTLTHLGAPEDATVSGDLTGACGDRMEVFLRIEAETVRRAGFRTTGCAPSAVCAQVACELAEGKSLELAACMESDDILSVVPGLPEDHHHCAHLASRTVREAIRAHWQQGCGEGPKPR